MESMAVSIASYMITKIRFPNYSRMKAASATTPLVDPPTQQPQRDLNVPSGVQHVMASIALHPPSTSPLSLKSATGSTSKTWELTPSAPLLDSTAFTPAKCFTSLANHALRSFWNRIGVIGRRGWREVNWNWVIVLNVLKSCLNFWRSFLFSVLNLIDEHYSPGLVEDFVLIWLRPVECKRNQMLSLYPVGFFYYSKTSYN